MKRRLLTYEVGFVKREILMHEASTTHPGSFRAKLAVPKTDPLLVEYLELIGDRAGLSDYMHALDAACERIEELEARESGPFGQLAGESDSISDLYELLRKRGYTILQTMVGDEGLCDIWEVSTPARVKRASRTTFTTFAQAVINTAFHAIDSGDVVFKASPTVSLATSPLRSEVFVLDATLGPRCASICVAHDGFVYRGRHLAALPHQTGEELVCKCVLRAAILEVGEVVDGGQ